MDHAGVRATPAEPSNASQQEATHISVPFISGPADMSGQSQQAGGFSSLRPSYLSGFDYFLVGLLHLPSY